MEGQGDTVSPLSEKDLAPDPLAQFGAWLKAAEAESGQRNPNAMTLCTVGADGWPQGRMVLLKGWGQDGLCFYTNLGSEKALALKAVPKAELVFHWDKMGRQVRVRGSVQAMTPAEAAVYFASRARESRLGAWASMQSLTIASREALEAVFQAVEKKFSGREVPLPSHWGGFRLEPDRFEFWQEGAHRFHDRFRYERRAQSWSLSRLQP